MEPVAIIGIGCRWPGGPTPDDYWELLCRGADAVTEVPADRWDSAAFHDPQGLRPGSMTTRWGGFLDRIAEFDSGFFGISPREAVKMDPQQRILLEVAYEALEDAGLPQEALAGQPVGVFVGAMNNDHAVLHLPDFEHIDTHTGPGASLGVIANRLSYAFDFRGASMTLDTACSSSLVAVHLACQSLRSGECGPVALAAGVNLILSPAGTIFFSRAGVLSSDGPTRTFDTDGSGFSRAEGAGVVVLKPLTQAEVDGDRIYAVIRGSAINQDGRTNGLMAPSRWSQERVLRAAYRQAEISPGKVQYVELHGTATQLGDPIEASALGAVLATDRPAGSRCLVGCAKANIGHAESAAGMAGLIKVALMLRKRMIPPLAHFEALNRHIDLDRLPIEVPRRLMPWPTTEGPALAGVSSFGFGGTNAHVVLQEHTTSGRAAAPSASSSAQWHLLPLSARSPAARTALAEALRDQLGGELAEAPLAAVCHAAGRRSHHDHRLAVVARTVEEAHRQLAAHLHGGQAPDVVCATGRAANRLRIAFVLPGQGPQWWGMAHELLATQPAFQDAVLRCDAIFRDMADWSLVEELSAAEPDSRLQHTARAQPALFALQIGLAALWKSWGIRPDLLIGHSAGEIAAAHLAGSLSLDSALRLSFERGQVMERTHGCGAMAVLRTGVEEVRGLLRALGGDLEIAAVNSPESTVVAGNDDAVARLGEAAAQRGIAAVRLPVPYAFHHTGMEPLAAELRSRLEVLEASAPELPVISTLTGRPVSAGDFGIDYWCAQMRSPVLFADAIAMARSSGRTVFVELSPDPVLRRDVVRTAPDAVALPSLRRSESSLRSLLRTAAELYTRGAQLDWRALTPGPWQLLTLPRYPWQRAHYFERPSQPTGAEEEAPGAGGGNGLLGRGINASDSPSKTYWEADISPESLPFLWAHRIRGSTVFLGMAMVELALDAGRDAFPGQVVSLGDFRLIRPLRLPESGSVRVQVVSDTAGDGPLRVRLFSAGAGSGAWSLHAEGRLRVEDGDAPPLPRKLDDVGRRCDRTLAVHELYGLLKGHGYDFGDDLQLVEECRMGPDETFSLVRVPSIREDCVFHPAALDAASHALIALVAEREGSETFVPVSFERIAVHRPAPGRVWSHARLRPESGSSGAWVGDANVYDESGQLVAELCGGRMARLPEVGDWSRDDGDDCLYELTWVPEPTAPSAGASPAPGRWVILADRLGIGQALSGLLAARGISASVFAAEEAVGDAGDTLDVARLLGDAIRDGDPLHVVHLWSLNAPHPTDIGPDGWARALSPGPVSSLETARALVRCAGERGRLWLITRGAQAASPDDSPDPVQAAIWGLGRALRVEHPELVAGLIDLDPTEGPSESASLLLAELSVPTRPTQDVLHRGARRLVPRLRRAAQGPAADVELDPDGAYVVTGGLGALGLSTARWLVDHGARHLVLMGRSALPARTKWPHVEPGSPVARKVAEIAGLERDGATVHCPRVDVSDHSALKAWLEQHRNDGAPPIRGVVHAAGIVSREALADTAPTSLRRALEAKLKGVWALDRVLADEPLSFFVLYSSVRSLLTTPGYGTYAAANAALDAFADMRRSRGLPALSIGWAAWSGAGMAASQSGDHSPQQAVRAIDPAQGMRLFGQLVGASRQGQIFVLPADWDVWRRQQPDAVHRWPALCELVPPAGPPTGAGVAAQDATDALVQVPARERAALIEQLLTDEAARILGASSRSLDGNTPLTAFGMDSLMMVEFKNRIHALLGVDLPVSTLWSDAGLHHLAGEVALQFGDEPEDRRLALLLDEIEGLSPAELESRLKDVT